MTLTFSAAPLARSEVAAAEGSLAGKRVVLYGMNFSPEIAGVGKYSGEIAQYFASKGAEVTVVTTPPHYPGWSVQDGHANWYSATREDGMVVIRCPLLLRRRMRGVYRLLAPVSFAVSSSLVAFFAIVAKRPDVVLCVEPTLFTAPITFIASRLRNVRTVLHVQDLEVDAAFAVGHLPKGRWFRRLGNAFERICLNRFDRIVTISDKMAAKLADKGVDHDRLAVVRNWVDLEQIYPLNGENPYRAELGLSDDDFVVLYSGNIGLKQGLQTLLEAASQLTGRTRIRFLIAGEGPAKQALQDRYGRLSNVRFLPFQPVERLNQFLNLADLHALTQDAGAADLVLPSKLGGMLATGRPIVVTATEDTEIADFLSGVAMLVSPGDAQALADAILTQAEAAKSDEHAKRARLRSKTLDKRMNLATFTRIVFGSDALPRETRALNRIENGSRT